MELGQRHLSAVAGIFDNLTRSSGLRGAVVCTGNSIRVDDMTESPKLRNDRASVFRPGRLGLAIQVEDAA